MSISFIRTLILYSIIVAALRVMGKRQIGELEPSELVITILVSELAAIPMQDLGIPLTAGIVPILTLISLEILMSFLCLKSIKLRKLLNGKPAVIIRNGKLDRKKMQQIRVTTDEVLEALRQQNISSIDDLKHGQIESNGQLSYILKPQKQPVTAEMLNLSPKDNGIPLAVISDGHLIQENLKLLNQTPEHILKMVKKAHISEIENVFLMTLDHYGNYFLQAKEGKM